LVIIKFHLKMHGSYHIKYQMFIYSIIKINVIYKNPIFCKIHVFAIIHIRCFQNISYSDDNISQ
jgi:hypothetical protein